MKIFKLLGLATTLSLATIPFVLMNKHEIVCYDYGTKLGNKVDDIKKEIKEIKEKVVKLENKVDLLEKKIDKAQICQVKKDTEELKKIVYALIGTIGGSSVLIGGTNLIKKKK